MFHNILLAFIPVFVAVDAIGVLPIFISFTRDIGEKDRIKIIYQSLITALCLAFGFVFLGKAVFKLLNISIGDFMIAGGAVLFCIAIMDVLNPGKRRRVPAKDLGAVPLGTPLIVGPAVLTTALIIIPEYGLFATLGSITINVFIAGAVFLFSEFLIKLLGEAGAKALSKVTSLLLAAIAIMMIRRGIFLFFV
ncbi:MAG: MarC family protein [Candidatus Omnitrophica bacterium]|nr:MarC family protein [Candidatus Omnitrophota bacterium]MBU1853320.1 MarC family protein [Candidatus Omnitrophota bacterium]